MLKSQASLERQCKIAKKAFLGLSPELQIAVARSTWVDLMRAVWFFEYRITDPDAETIAMFKERSKERISDIKQARKYMREHYKNVLGVEAKLKKWRKLACRSTQTTKKVA